MSHTFALLDDIKSRLEADFEGVQFRCPINGGRATDDQGNPRFASPKIHVGQLPPKRSQARRDGTTSDDYDDDDIPFIVVKLLASQITGEKVREYTVDVGIVIAAFVPGEIPAEGVREVLLMAERILTVLSISNFWADQRFAQSLPITFIHGLGKADDVYASGLQAAGPYYMGAITTQFKSSALPKTAPPNTIDRTYTE